MANPTFELYQPDRELTRAQVIDELERTPKLLRGALAGASAGTLERRAADGEWSPMEVLRHFRDAVHVYGMRFKFIALQDDPFLPDYDENRWAARSPDGPADVAGMLDEIAAYRGETVRLLRSLAPDAWTRTGRHETNGPVVLEPYVRHELAHEEQHLAQLRRALSSKP
jgi:hypothetical protein